MSEEFYRLANSRRIDVRSKSDAGGIPPGLKLVRVCCRLTVPLVQEIMKKSSSVEKIVLTNFSYERASSRVFRFLERSDIAVVRDFRTGGRPVELSKEQVKSIDSMRESGLSYREIAARLGCSHTAVANHCRGLVKKKRWREEYEKGEGG